MILRKEAVVGVGAQEEEQLNRELEAMNLQSKTPLTKEQVYLFSVRLCDNQVDRDGEYFDRAALEQLALMFVGKSGIFDHEWSAKNQTARIYRTQVVDEAGLVEESGESCCFLKGYAYMLRNEENESLIAEIEGGIKKEVSVSCSVGACLCSICGNDMNNRQLCSHVKGREYGGKRCVAKLTDPTDAYEWSFVAVPAQVRAGVMKALGDWAKDQPHLAKLEGEALAKSFSQMEEEARLGRAYLEQLRGETVRLGLLAQEGMESQSLAAICEKLSPEELWAMKAAFQVAAEKKFPLAPQLRYQTKGQEKVAEDAVFRI